jgi:hypothetical protein
LVRAHNTLRAALELDVGVVHRCEVLEVFAAIARFRRLVSFWFVRLVWAPTLAWGLFNCTELAFGGLRGAALEEKTADAAIRTGLGLVLGLLWLFGVRTRGPFTLNRDGRLER